MRPCLLTLTIRIRLAILNIQEPRHLDGLGITGVHDVRCLSTPTDGRRQMYHHVKKLMYTVRVDEPDPRFGNMLLEQFGGLTASSLRQCSIPFKG